MYRDELEQARKRIEDLDAQVAAQEDEIRAVRTQLDHRAGARTAPHRRGPASTILLVVGVVAAASGAAWALVARSGPAPADQATASTASGAASVRWSRRVRPPRQHPGFDLEMPSDVGVKELAGRCKRSPSRGIEQLPGRATVLDFDTCARCDCCLPEGRFPRQPSDLREACQDCSRAAALAASGLVPEGWFEPHPVRRHGLKVVLKHPARMVAMEFSGVMGHVVGQEPPRDEMALVAYDADDRAIDAARTTLARLDPPGPGPERWSSLRVEACPGETIARVEVSTNRLTLDIERIALLPAE